MGPEDYYNHDWQLATLTVDHRLGEHTLTGILGYWETETAWRLDVDGGPHYALNTDLRDTYDQLTAELRLLSPPGSSSSTSSAAGTRPRTCAPSSTRPSRRRCPASSAA